MSLAPATSNTSLILKSHARGATSIAAATKALPKRRSSRRLYDYERCRSAFLTLEKRILGRKTDATHLIRGRLGMSSRELCEQSRLAHGGEAHEAHSRVACLAHVEPPASATPASLAPGVGLQKLPFSPQNTWQSRGGSADQRGVRFVRERTLRKAREKGECLTRWSMGCNDERLCTKRMPYHAARADVS